MKLPLIRHICTFVEANDEDFVAEAIEVLEHLTDYDGLGDQGVYGSFLWEKIQGVSPMPLPTA